MKDQRQIIYAEQSYGTNSPPYYLDKHVTHNASKLNKCIKEWNEIQFNSSNTVTSSKIVTSSKSYQAFLGWEKNLPGKR